MKLEVKVTAYMLNIRKNPGTAFQIVGVLNKDTIVQVDKEQNGWYHLSNGKGWIRTSYTQVVRNLEQTPPPAKTPTTPTNKPVVTNGQAPVETTQTSPGLDAKVIQMLYDTVKTKNSKIGASTRLFGSPHQFIRQTDFRMSTDDLDLGRKYLETIVGESPIVYFLPGRPSYLPDLDQKQRDSMKEFLKGKQVNADDAPILAKILDSKESRYFTFLTDYSSYIRYVNLLCRMAAIYMGIGDKNAPNTNTPYKYYDWGNYRYQNNYQQKPETKKSLFDLSELKTSAYEELFGNYQYVQFYVEPNTSFNESASNTTMQSKLEGFFDSAEGLIKELAFLTNSMALQNIQAAQDNFADGMRQISEKMLKNSNEGFFQRLLGMSSTVLKGSNIIFPELWGDAAYNKSYSININLVSPYGDKESVYLNVIVPLMHILALALPRQTTANSYASPFLVKVFAKGWFSCEMGIIDSLSIEKGGQGSWTVDGLPSEMRVQISVKDLYSNLMITGNNSPDLFFQNRGMLDFLAVTCGLDITKPQFATQLDAIFATLFNTAADIPANLYRDFIQSIRNSIENIYKF